MFQSYLNFTERTIVECKPQIKTLTESLFCDGEFESQVGKAVRTCRRLMKVRVYRNLNKPEFYSILAREGADKGKVVGYARAVLLENCEFIVSSASRNRVLREKRKNVHAFCQGIIVDASETSQLLTGEETIVTYNPYKMETFYKRIDDSPYSQKCNQALLQGSDVHITESAL
jgi:hypothetical protein